MQEPDAGLDSGTPGSHPGPGADAQLLSHLGAPQARFCIKMWAGLKRLSLRRDRAGLTLWVGSVAV